MSVPVLSVTVQKAMSITGLGRTKINELISSGELRATKSGTRRLIFFDSIQTYLEANADNARAP